MTLTKAGIEEIRRGAAKYSNESHMVQLCDLALIGAAVQPRRCPKCKGKKGFDDTTYDRTGTWENCNKCEGFGTVLDLKKIQKALSALPKPQEPTP